MDAQSARLAASPRGLSLIDSLPPYDEAAVLTVSTSLRQAGAPSDLVALALTQSRLRSSARAKFGDFARGMLFTQEGLEQATRLVVAAHHADRYRSAGVGSVADLTCGIGADSMAFASLGLDVVAFEVDEATAVIADHNLRHWDNAAVVHGDSLAALSTGALDVDALFADPARRNASGRKHDPRDYRPALADLLEVREHYGALGIKVGPGIDHGHIPSSDESPVEAQWVSVDGDVVEAGLWCGPLARTPGHTALVLSEGSAHVLAGSTDRAPDGPLGEFILEPDGAVIRAGLLGELADRLDARLVHPTIAYLTTDKPASTSFATQYRVIESLPYSERALAAALRARSVGVVEIKKRGMDLSPEALRARLRLKGDATATVIITRVGSKRLALIVERLHKDQPPVQAA